MKQLQGLISETNQLMEHAGFEMSVPLGQEGVLYEISETTFWLPQGIGRIDELRSDYVERKGIGVAVPPISGLPEVLADTQAAAAKIVAIQEKYINTLHDISYLCHHHVTNPYVHASRVNNGGGILRLQIDAQSAVYQLLFPIPHGLYFVAHEWPLSDVVKGGAFYKKPFSQIPPDFLIPDGQSWGHFVPATQENIILADSHTSPNARSKKAPYKSRSAEVFQRFSNMVWELMSA
jgi:hypothetical protein